MLRQRLLALSESQMNARQLAGIRIGFGVLVLLKAFDLWPRLQELVGPFENRPRYFSELPELLFAGVPTALAIVWAATAVALIVGYKSRWAARLLCCLIPYVLLCDTRLFNQHIYLMWLLSLLFSLSECEAAMSITSRSRRAPTEVPAWPAFLMMVQLSVVYGFAAITKWNVDFLSGLVVHETAMVNPMAKNLLSPELRDAFAFNVAVAAFGVVTESLLAFGLWVPALRPFLFTLGLVFHVGMLVLMPSDAFHIIRLSVFGGLLLVLYPLFIPAPRKARVVTFDASDQPTLAQVALLRGLDWFTVLRFEPAEEPKSGERLTFVDLDGGIYTGRTALRQALSVLPLTSYAGLLLAYPPARKGRFNRRRASNPP